jgi:hypothetical protein
MKFHVTFRTFKNITGEEEIAKHRQLVGQKLQEIRDSGKMLDGAVFIDDRAGYCVMDVDSEEQLFDLISPMQDNSDIEIHPLVSYEKMEEFFEKEMESMHA